MNRGTIDRFASLILAVLVCLSLWSVIFACAFGDGAVGPSGSNMTVEYCRTVSEGGWFAIQLTRLGKAPMPPTNSSTWNAWLVDEVDVLLDLPDDFTLIWTIYDSAWGRKVGVSRIVSGVLVSESVCFVVQAPLISKDSVSYLITLDTTDGPIYLPVCVLNLESNGLPTILVNPPPEPQPYPPVTYPWWINMGYGASFPVATWMFSLTVHAFFFWLAFAIEVWIWYLWWKKEPVNSHVFSLLAFLAVLIISIEPTVHLFGIEFPLIIPVFAAQTYELLPYIKSKMKKEARKK